MLVARVGSRVRALAGSCILIFICRYQTPATEWNAPAMTRPKGTMIIHAVVAHTACAFAMCFTSKDGRLSTLTWAVWTPQSVPPNHLSASLSSALYSLTDFGLISCPGKVTFVVITRSWRYYSELRIWNSCHIKLCRVNLPLHTRSRRTCIRWLVAPDYQVQASRMLATLGACAQYCR